MFKNVFSPNSSATLDMFNLETSYVQIACKMSCMRHDGKIHLEALGGVWPQQPPMRGPG